MQALASSHPDIGAGYFSTKRLTLLCPVDAELVSHILVVRIFGHWDRRRRRRACATANGKTCRDYQPAHKCTPSTKAEVIQAQERNRSNQIFRTTAPGLAPGAAARAVSALAWLIGGIVPAQIERAPRAASFKIAVDTVLLRLVVQLGNETMPVPNL